MRTRLIMAVVAALMTMSLVAGVATASQSFTDVEFGSTFQVDIEKLANSGITKGCNPPENSRFCPSDNVTRGQMAAFLVRGLGLTDEATTNFTDDDGSIFEADIEKLAAAGITKGCNPPANTEFCPNDNVTREQMAAFLSRALNLADSPLVTSQLAGAWAITATVVASSGAADGISPGTVQNFDWVVEYECAEGLDCGARMVDQDIAVPLVPNAMTGLHVGNGEFGLYDCVDQFGTVVTPGGYDATTDIQLWATAHDGGAITAIGGTQTIDVTATPTALAENCLATGSFTLNLTGVPGD